MRVGIMTGGGDSSGINAAIWSVVRRAHHYGWEVVGLRRGWAGLLEQDTVPLTMEAVAGIPYTGGTFIHTSRTNVFKIENGPQKALDSIKALGLDALIAMGGDDTLGVAHKLCEMGLPAVGLPQTIDNDIGETDFSIGYDTAVNICTEAIQRMHSTNYSHQADMLVEVMGRDAGWIAVNAGLAGGCHYLCIPEVPVQVDDLAAHLAARKKAGAPYSMVCVSEGVQLSSGSVAGELDAFGHAKPGGIANALADDLKAAGVSKPRVVIISYLQRSGPPSSFDMLLGIRMGATAVDLLQQKTYDRMVAAKGGQLVPVPLADALARNRTVDLGLYELAQQLCKEG